ncbi:MAG TPA: serine hydrolase domain-containing protein [Vicinamibacterales bacterium]
MRTRSISCICLAGALVAAVAPARSQTTVALPESVRTRIDSIVAEELKKSGAPSVSLAIVKDGAIAYANAYGDARVQPPTKATPSMRYSIGSVSKQFTATAILLLAEEGKLSLDDKVAKFVPDLTRAKDVTIRQLLSMTSGYQDYWPQDYVMAPMKNPITARQIMTDWAGKPLDFDPGTKWQYSNTNYVIAGAVVEKAAGEPLVEFLKERVFGPLKMDSVTIIDEGSLGTSDPERYERFGVGPPRIAPKEGSGWLYAAAELAMSLSDLAKWDISVINQSLLKPASYRAQQTTIVLADGRSTGYGLGVNVGAFQGHRLISHGGEVSGFSTTNMIFPDDRMAIAVSANLFVTEAQATIANRIATLLFAETDPATDKAVALAREIFSGFQKGQIDRTLFTPNANAYFEAMALTDLKASLGPCGKVKAVRQTGTSLRGGMTSRNFAVECGSKDYSVSTFVMPDGKIEQYIVTP